MLIDIIAEFIISGAKIPHLSGRTKINVPFRDAARADVDLDLSGRRCTVQICFLRAEPDVITHLVEGKKLVQRIDYPLVLDRLDAEVRSTAETVLHAWKFLVARDEMIPEGALAGISRKWKESSTGEWRQFPSWIDGSFTVRQIPKLEGVAAEQLQQVVADGVAPLVGMRYLHRAKAEADPKYRWVDATIAAELSIKEILQMARPDTEVLFNNLPSPPLTKLYGEVLAAYLGERSPYLKALSAGVEKRNTLVHRPSVSDIDATMAAEYVSNVESAIFHALALLFKGKSYFDLWKDLHGGSHR